MVTKNKNLQKIGKKIRLIRKSLGFTQEEFASLSKLDRAYYGGIERGERNVSAINIIRIAKALNIEIGEIFPPIDTLD